MGEQRGGMEMEWSVWQRKTGALTGMEGVWRQPGEPSQASNSTLDLLTFIPNPPNMMTGLWGTLSLPANNKLFYEHHWVIFKYSGPVLFLPLFSVFLHRVCQGKTYLMPNG